MKFSQFFFKLCVTGVVLVIALSIAVWVGLLYGIWPIVKLIAVLSGIALVVGIIAFIWEEWT